jgi:hypothetical protein
VWKQSNTEGSAGPGAALLLGSYRRSLLRTKGVSEGSSRTENVAGVEVTVVVDPVIVYFGADKDVSPHVVADAAADMHEPLIAVKASRATSRVIATRELTVEDYALASDAGHEVGAGFLTQAGREYYIEVVKNGTKLLIAVIEPLPGSGRDFCVEADAILENDVSAEAGVVSALLRWWQISQGGSVVLGGESGAGAQGQVNLLGVGASGKQKNSTRGCD